jgi:hypothetical protein
MTHNSQHNLFSKQKAVLQLTEAWQQRAEEERFHFLLGELQRQREATDPDPFLYFMEDTLYHQTFFLTEPVKEKLLEMGLDSRFFRWFPSLEAVLQELDAISAPAKVELPNGEWVLETIQTHLHAQWWPELSAWVAQTSTEKEKQNNQAQTLANTISHIPPEDMLRLQSLAEELQRHSSEEEIQEGLSAILESNASTMYLGSIVSLSTGEERWGNAFYESFFSFFALLDQHRQYLSEEAFFRAQENRGASYIDYRVAMVKSVVEGYTAYAQRRKR